LPKISKRTILLNLAAIKKETGRPELKGLDIDRQIYQNTEEDILERLRDNKGVKLLNKK